MAQKKKVALSKRAAPEPLADAKPLDVLMEEGRRLRQIVHEQFRDARVVGDDAMRFLVR